MQTSHHLWMSVVALILALLETVLSVLKQSVGFHRLSVELSKVTLLGFRSQRMSCRKQRDWLHELSISELSAIEHSHSPEPPPRSSAQCHLLLAAR